MQKQLSDFGCALVCIVLSCRTIPVTLVLKDPRCTEQDLGSLELAVTLTPKDSPVEERRDSTVLKQLHILSAAFN